MNQYRQLGQVKGFLLARLFAKLGDNFLRFAIPLLAYKATNNVAFAGLAFSCQWVPRIAFLPIGGTVVDALGSRRAYLLFEGMRALSLLLGTLLLAFHLAPEIAVVCLISAVTSISGAVVFIALEKAIAERLDSGERAAAQSAVQVIEQVTLVASPVIGGLVTQWGGGAWSLGLATIIFLLSVTLAWLDRVSSTAAATDDVPTKGRLSLARAWSDVKGGWTILMGGAALKRMIALTALMNLVSGIVMATVAVVATGSLGISSFHLGIGTGAAGLFTILAVSSLPLWAKDGTMPRLFDGTGLAVAVGAICLSQAHQSVLFFGIYALTLSCSAIFAVALRTLRSNLIPTKQLGSCLSLMMLLNQAPIALSGILVSSLGSRLGAPHVVLLVGGVSLAASLIVIGLLPRSVPQTTSAAPAV